MFLTQFSNSLSLAKLPNTLPGNNFAPWQEGCNFSFVCPKEEPPRSCKRHHRFACQVVLLQKGVYYFRGGVPPDGKADKNDVVGLHVGFGGDCGATIIGIDFHTCATVFICPIEMLFGVGLLRYNFQQIALDDLCKPACQPFNIKSFLVTLNFIFSPFQCNESVAVTLPSPSSWRSCAGVTFCILPSLVRLHEFVP